MAAKSGVSILGIYAADLQFHAPRQPAMGETLIGAAFGIGPGGKGSNQAVACARAGGKVTFISRVGKDVFGDTALRMYGDEGINALVPRDEKHASGAAYIFIQEGTGANAIIVVPGAAGQIGIADVDAARAEITSSAVFMTQLETPISVGHYALKMARDAGVTTIFNPAPAAPLDDEIYRYCDYCTPNESEASMLTGVEVTSTDTAKKAADVLLKKGVGTALITLGVQGALLHGKAGNAHIPITSVGKVVDTTGAGDAFNGGFAAALSKGMAPEQAAHFGSAVAGISVTRPGTAPSMPHLAEVEALLKR